jgi:hypothetical protein
MWICLVEKVLVHEKLPQLVVSVVLSLLDENAAEKDILGDVSKPREVHGSECVLSAAIHVLDNGS